MITFKAANFIEAQKQGAEAALVKYAIEYKSPKMQQILQGAMDKAYASGVTGRPVGAVPQTFAATKGSLARLSERPDYRAIVRNSDDGLSRFHAEKRTLSLPGEGYAERPLGDQLRQIIFGGGSSPRGRNTERSTPYATGLPIKSSKRDMIYLRSSTAPQYPAAVVERKLGDPRFQKVVERHAPGGVEQLRKHIAAARGEGPVPAFNAQKLKPPEGQ